MADGRSVTQSLLDLAAALQGGELDDNQRRNIEAKVKETDLLEQDRVPDWLVDVFDAVRTRTATAGWVPFKLHGLDDTDALDLVRELDQVVPMTFENNEESWLLKFPSVGLEAALSFEGSSYKVSPLGGTWD